VVPFITIWGIDISILGMKRIINNPYKTPPTKRSAVDTGGYSPFSPILPPAIDTDEDIELFEQALLRVPIPTLPQIVTPSDVARLPTPKKPVDTIIGVYRVLSHGQQCLLCSAFVSGQSWGALYRHIKKCSSVKAKKVLVNTNWSRTFALINTARLSLEVDSTAVVHQVVRLWCFCCNRHFATRTSFMYHQKHQGCTAPPRNGIYDVLPTGHYIPVTANSLPSPPNPPPPARKELTYDEAATRLSPFIPEDEKVESFIPLFFPLLFRYPDLDFQSVVSPLVDLWKAPVSLNQSTISDAIDSAKGWLSDRASYDVQRVPGNIRAKLLLFDPQDIGEVSQNLVYNFRHHAETLAPELEKLVLFLLRFPSNCIGEFKAKANQTDPSFIPRLLLHCFLECPPNLNASPILVDYCLSRMCNVDLQDKLTMVSSGSNASMISAVLSICRAAVCSVLCTVTKDFDTVSTRLVRSTQECRVSNILCPAIRVMRELQRAKGRTRFVTVDTEGNICVDSFYFPFLTWKLLIPSISSVLTGLLSNCLPTLLVHMVFDPSKILSVAQDFSFHITSGSEVYSSASFMSGVTASVLDHNTVDRLVGYLQLAFHGLGVGSLRLEELLDLNLSSCRWHRDNIYYSSRSRKKYSHKTNGGSANSIQVEHKLPRCISCAYLLFRLIVQKVKNRVFSHPDKLLPMRATAAFKMQFAVAELFGFPSTPSATQVRHFWTSAINFVFPSGNLSTAISADQDAAEMSGHSAGTHLGNYSSQVVGGMERIYLRFHNALGDGQSMDSESTNTGVSDALSVERRVLRALGDLYGEGCNFKSLQQRSLLLLSSSDSDHVHGDLPCGGGKSLSWVVPLMMSCSGGPTESCRLVVTPYKFLAAFHCDSLKQLTKNKLRLWVSSLTGGDVSEHTVPNLLLHPEFLPNVIFMSLEAFSRLLKYHFNLISRLCASKILARIYIDEMHTILIESFRPAYEQLRRVGSLNCPVTTLSASLPNQLTQSVHSYMGMRPSDVTVISGDNILGEFPSGFILDVSLCSNSVQLCLQRVETILALYGDNDAIHVFAASKREAQRIHDCVSKNFPCAAIGLVTSAVEDQGTVASKWRSSELTLLVSTTSALVGNENPMCRHIIICGTIYNVLNVVQAFGRLRPSQRKAGGSIYFYVDEVSQGQLKCLEDDALPQFQHQCARDLIPDNISIFRKYLSPVGIHEWVNSDGCLVKNLSLLFGKYVSDCGICNICRGLKRQASVNTVSIRRDETIRLQAKDILRQLELQCLVCKSSECDGEGCLVIGVCYVCGGSGHFRRDCQLKWSSILGKRGCHSCSDIFGREEFRQHQPTECPLKRRLRRILFHFLDSKKPVSRPTMVSSIFSEEMSFFKFLASAFTHLPPNRSSRIQQLKGVQVLHGIAGTPLLPPDNFSRAIKLCHNANEASRFTRHESAIVARELYNRLAKHQVNIRKHRGFVVGALYDKLYSGYYEVDAREVDQVSIEITVDLGNKRTQTTVVSVFNFSRYLELVQSLQILGGNIEDLRVKGNCRKGQEDVGSMRAIGIKSQADGTMYSESDNP
jgi:DEAD/DEAH box helicase/Zinc knuckle